MRSRRNRWKSRSVLPFASEAALCEALRASARALGWSFYPETGGWDAVLVLPDETQVGVQAKLRANVDVLAQSIVPLRRVGPDVHAVLVPTCSIAFRDVARELGFAILIGDILRGEFDPDWRGARWDDVPGHLQQTVARAPRSTHLPGRCWLPPYVPDGPAGVASPRSVSAWRVAAARLCADIRAGLEPTNAELKERGLAPSTWYRWLDPVPGTRPRRYALRRGVALPDVAFPDVSRALGLPEPERAGAL